MRRPPWYLSPYVVALGLLDWLKECAGVSYSEALHAAGQEVRKEGYPFVRRLGVGAALLGLLVLCSSWFGPSAMRSVADTIPPSLLVPLSATVPVIATGLLLRAALCALAACIGNLYSRGLKVLEQRERGRRTFEFKRMP